MHPSRLQVTQNMLFAIVRDLGSRNAAGRSCGGSISFEAGRSYYVTPHVRLLAHNGTYTASLPVDGFIPGHCKWHFTGLQFAVTSARAPMGSPYVYTQSYDNLALHGDNNAGNARITIWCMRNPRGNSSLGYHMCDTPETLVKPFREYIPPALLRSTTPAALNQFIPVLMGPNTTSMTLTFLDPDRLRARQGSARTPVAPN